jgi:hypothetical protein
MRKGRPVELEIVASVSGLVIHANRAAAQQRKALASLSQSIALGMPRDEADRGCKQACLDNAGWKYYPNVQKRRASVALIQSQLTFGAKNWVVYFVYEDDVVVAALVRTEDWRRLRPIGSPQDRVRDARASRLVQFSQSRTQAAERSEECLIL